MFSDYSPIQVGLIAETLVAYRLRRMGYDVTEACAGMPYDLIVTIKGRIYKVQVKGTANTQQERNKKPFWCWLVTKGCNKKAKYKEEDYDILACVAVPTETIYYRPFKDRFKVTRTETKHTSEAEERSWQQVLGALNS